VSQTRQDYWDQHAQNADAALQADTSYLTNPAYNRGFFSTSGVLVLMNSSPDKAAFASQYSTQDLVGIEGLNHSQTTRTMVDSTLKDWADYITYVDTRGILRTAVANGANPTAVELGADLGNVLTRQDRFGQLTDIAQQEGFDTSPAPGPSDPAAARWGQSLVAFPEGRVQSVETLRTSMPSDVPAGAKPQPEVKAPNNLADLIQLRQQGQRQNIKVPVLGNINIPGMAGWNPPNVTDVSAYAPPPPSAFNQTFAAAPAPTAITGAPIPQRRTPVPAFAQTGNPFANER